MRKIKHVRRVFLHAFLVFSIIIILFPTIWVITTSFRRDEAAFSSDLFTTRLTLQNYIDLVAPEKNVPILIQDMQNILSRAKPYNELSYSQAEQKISVSLQKITSYLKETRLRYEDARKSYEYISEFLQNHSEEIKNTASADLEHLKETVSKKIMDKIPFSSEEFMVVLYEYLSKEKYGSAVFNALKDDLSSLTQLDIDSSEDFENALEKLKMIYDSYIGKYSRQYETKTEELELLNKDLAVVRSQLNEFQKEILNLDMILNQDLINEMNSIMESLENLLDLKNSLMESSVENPWLIEDEWFFASISSIIEQLEKIKSRFEGFLDYEAVLNTVDRIISILYEFDFVNPNMKKKLIYSDLLRAYQELQPRIERIAKELDELSINLPEKINTFKQLGEKFSELNSTISDLKAQQEEISAKLETINSQFNDERMMVNLKIFLSQLENRISTVSSIKSFEKADLLKYSAVLNWLRGFFNSYNERDEVYEELKRVIDKMRWIEEYRTFATKFENFSKNLESVFIDVERYLQDFQISWKQLLKVSFNGIFVTSEPLSKLYDVVKLDFVTRVRSDMAVVMRKSGVLMKIAPFSQLKDDFGAVDKNLFRVDQIWKQKTKHYFLRWVLNSVIVSLIVAFITTAVCAVAAYPFSRMRFVGRRYGILSLLLIQMFPSVIFMVAIYNLLNFLGRYIDFLGIDSLGGLIFAYLTNIAYNMYLIKGFYDLIPPSLEEAAIVDGATRFQSFYKIVLPLAQPILTVVFLLVFIGTFNEYVIARIILQNVQNYTYALGLWAFSTGPYETEWGLFTAASLLGMMPMVILFLSLQRYLVSGLTRGAVKE